MSVEKMKNGKNKMEWWTGGVMASRQGRKNTESIVAVPDAFFRPSGAFDGIIRANPPINRWAIFGRPSGTNQKSKIKNQKSGFTLIELLVVMSIIAILAALVLGGASYAMAAARRSRAQTELAALTAAIDAYKLKKGYYPPCNVSNTPSGPTNITTHSPLYYELTGVISSNASSITYFHSPLTQETLNSPANPTQGTYPYLFGTGGVDNSSPDPTEIQNFYPGMKLDRHGALYITAGQPPTYTLMILSVHGPRDFPSSGTAGQIYNFYHYVSVQGGVPPVHNKNSYDLWVDILVHGKTNRISNWSKDPEIVNDWQD